MFLTPRKSADVSQPSMQSSVNDFNTVISRLDDRYVSNDTGVAVTTTTAMRQATVYACVRIHSEIIAQLPIEVQQRRNGSWVNVENHRLKQTLQEPNEWQTGHDFMQFLVTWAELSGDGYYYKVYNGQGEVAQLLPIPAKSCTATLRTNDMALDYQVSTDYGLIGRFKRDRIFHYRNFGTEGFKGLSTIGAHARNIGLAMQLENHAVNAYKNGLQSKLWLKLEEGLTEEQKPEFEEFLAKFSGPKNAGKIPYFAGADLNALDGMSAVDAQYIETRKLQQQQIAAIFGIPLFLLNDTDKSTTWGTGLEQISRAFVRFSLNPRLNRIKQTLHRELIRDGAKRETRVEFDTDQFTLGEFKDRMDGYRSGIESGVLNPNECRDLERRNPRDGGDEYRIPANVLEEGGESEPQEPTE